MPPPRLILASRSPRRAGLLREAGYSFEQMDPPFEDPAAPQGQDAHELTMELAQQKAQSLRDALAAEADRADSVILSADTVSVAVDGRLLGQPRDAEEAREMIQAFVGHRHPVVTGICLLRVGDGQSLAFADEAVVELGHLEPVMLEAYLASGAWRGKAGGYNLYDVQQAGWVIRVNGDPTTVVGLPMRPLADALACFGVRADLQ